MTRSTTATVVQHADVSLATAVSHPGWLDERLFPFQRRYLSIDECQVHYVDEGSGPVMLLLHGDTVWSFTYRHLILSLRGEFRCVAVDFPGFGLSTTPAGYRHTLSHYATLVERFIEQLQLRDVTLLAHDTGGPIGLGVVSRYPEWFRAVILLDTFCFPMNEKKAVAGTLKLFSLPFPGALLVDYLNLMPKAISAYGMKRRSLSSAEKAAFNGPFLDRSTRRVMREVFASVLDESDYLEQLQQRPRGLDIPALLLPSGGSGAVRHLLSDLEATFAHHRTRILEGAGHFSQEDAPDQILRAIGDWPVLRT